MSELAEGLRDTIIEYQVSPGALVTCRVFCLGAVQFAQQKSLYEQNCRLIVCPRLLCSGTDQMLTAYSRRQVSNSSTVGRRTLTSQQPNCLC